MTEDIATNTDNYYIVETGDYVYNPRISSAAPVGPISKNQFGTGVMSPLYTAFRFRSDANDFFAHYFKSSHWHGYLRRVSNSGARHDRMAITNDDLMRMPIPTPSPREQQKIADCLGSLDDLIAAEGRKLEALRQHKQGLMQQLFPQPGETRAPAAVSGVSERGRLEDCPHGRSRSSAEQAGPRPGHFGPQRLRAGGRAMTADKPSNLVPKLRFAEFVDEPPWECPPFKKLAKRITQRNTHGADLRALTNSAEHGVVDQREYFDRDIATNTDNYYIVETGDYVYNPRISSTAPVGPISKNQIGTGVMSPLYTVFRFRSDANDFFAHYFRSSHWHGYLRGVSNSGARHDRMAVTNDDLMQMPIPTPSPREQQKIADCLGSLDDLIAAEGRKLEALRQHKQG